MQPREIENPMVNYPERRMSHQTYQDVMAYYQRDARSIERRAMQLARELDAKRKLEVKP